MLKLYNTLTKKLEIFKPIKKNEVRMYSCGPTVYDYPHIGNYRAFVFSDLLKRYLIWKGYRVIQVMNITDIDDKIIKKVNESGKSREEITSFYEKAFKEGLKELDCLSAEHYPKPTEHIKEMQRLIQKLLDKKYAYLADDGIYYSISKFKDYGKLSGIKKEQLKIGARVNVQEYSKEQASDFVLWKKWRPEDGSVCWQAEFIVDGKKTKMRGRPGWHIECSAMSMHYLGETFDIHTGGTDLIFPHHENEIAQSEAITEKKFVNYWLHNAHLLVEGKKMSKSLGNYYTLKDLLEKKHKGSEIRYVLINNHYREELNFSLKELENAKKTLEHIKETILRLEKIVNVRTNTRTIKRKVSGIDEIIKKTRKKIEEAMDNDLNVPKALSEFFVFLHEINKRAMLLNEKDVKKIFEFMYNIDEIFGIGIKKIHDTIKKLKVPKEILSLVEKREKARKEKNFELADKLREEIKAKGFWVDDTPKGPIIKKLN